MVLGGCGGGDNATQQESVPRRFWGGGGWVRWMERGGVRWLWWWGQRNAARKCTEEILGMEGMGMGWARWVEWGVGVNC